MGYSWKLSRAKKQEFAKKMDEIWGYCCENGISSSRNQDSYYFSVNGQKYRISNHTIESSNARAYNEYGQQVRNKYHDDQRADNVIYIHASKTRLIEIHKKLLAGKKLDGHGYEIRGEK